MAVVHRVIPAVATGWNLRRRVVPGLAVYDFLSGVAGEDVEGSARVGLTEESADQFAGNEGGAVAVVVLAVCMTMFGEPGFNGVSGEWRKGVGSRGSGVGGGIILDFGFLILDCGGSAEALELVIRLEDDF